ncbi:MAG: hypothetical protein ACI8XG_002165, partial [Congregibacter sp.]
NVSINTNDVSPIFKNFIDGLLIMTKQAKV